MSFLRILFIALCDYVSLKLSLLSVFGSWFNWRWLWQPLTNLLDKTCFSFLSSAIFYRKYFKSDEATFTPNVASDSEPLGVCVLGVPHILWTRFAPTFLNRTVTLRYLLRNVTQLCKSRNSNLLYGTNLYEIFFRYGVATVHYSHTSLDSLHAHLSSRVIVIGRRELFESLGYRISIVWTLDRCKNVLYEICGWVENAFAQIVKHKGFTQK